MSAGSYLKPCYIPILIELARRGGGEKQVYVTETDLGDKLGKSQQVVSRHLTEMEIDGLIKKNRCQSRLYVQLTGQGCAFIKSLYMQLDSAFRMTEPSEIANEYEPDTPS